MNIDQQYMPLAAALTAAVPILIMLFVAHWQEYKDDADDSE